MGKHESYECDRCHYVQPRDRKFSENERWMRTITLYVEDGCVLRHLLSYQAPIAGRDQQAQVLWCEKCCDETGVSSLSRVSRPKPDAPAAPSLEDMIVDIVKDAMANAQS